MNEVEPRITQSSDRRMIRLHHNKAIPLHLWPLDLRWEQLHLTFQNPETIDPGRLFAALIEQLHTDTDTDERTATSGGLTCVISQPRSVQGPHTRTERANAWQHNSVGVTDEARVRREMGIGTNSG
jgi:hypothetical protein